MVADDDYRGRESEYMRLMDRHDDRVRDAHTTSHVARILAILALVLAAIALWVALLAFNKATDALNLSNRNLDTLQNRNE